MKKLSLAIALTLSILTTQAQTKSIPNTQATETEEDKA